MKRNKLNKERCEKKTNELCTFWRERYRERV